jgi:tryptophan halogenase
MDLLPPEPADAFRMSLEDGEIVIEFGRADDSLPTGEAPGESAVRVTDRVRLPIETGRRLLHTLSALLQPHEANLRAALAKGLSPAAAAMAARPGQTSPRPAQDQSGEQAARLLRMVGEWDVPHNYERSFQLSDGVIRSNRFLLTLNAADIPGGARESVLAVCGRMGMPEQQRAAAAMHFDSAKCVHFGFEGDAGDVICKLYLERQIPGEESRNAHARGESVLLHIAFKWNMLRDESVTTRYLWYPLLKADDIARRFAVVYRNGPADSREIAMAFLRLATDAASGAESLQYLEVEEAENARRSFDLNLYNARLRMRDAEHLLQRARTHFNIRPGQFQALYDQIRTLSLGHLAGGVHRDGRDFFNVYYGVVGLPRFNSGL